MFYRNSFYSSKMNNHNPVSVLLGYRTGRAIMCFVVVLALQLHVLAQSSSPISSQLNLARSGNTQAQVEVGRAYAEGTYERHNFQEARKWFEAASKAGSPEAKAWLGSMYLFGRGVKQDVARGAGLVQEAIQSNVPIAFRFLGLMYQNGLGVPQNFRQADALYDRASQQGDAGSFSLRAILYFKGLGVKSNPQLALEFLQRGAALGDAWSQLHLGELYSRVPPVQIGLDNSKQPGPSTEAQPNSNSVLNLHPDFSKALALFEDAAKSGNRIAAYRAGALLEEGVQVPRDYSKALAFYRSSAANGYGPSQQALGRMYELGLGTPVNLVKAYVHYNIAQILGAGRFGSNDAERIKPSLNPSELAQAEAQVQASPAKGMAIGNQSQGEVY